VIEDGDGPTRSPRSWAARARRSAEVDDAAFCSRRLTGTARTSQRQRAALGLRSEGPSARFRERASRRGRRPRRWRRNETPDRARRRHVAAGARSMFVGPDTAAAATSFARSSVNELLGQRHRSEAVCRRDRSRQLEFAVDGDDERPAWSRTSLPRPRRHPAGRPDRRRSTDDGLDACPRTLPPRNGATGRLNARAKA